MKKLTVKIIADQPLLIPSLQAVIESLKKGETSGQDFKLEEVDESELNLGKE